MKRALLTLLVLVALAGCTDSKPPESAAAAGVVKLFTHDGCTVYRFLDRHYRYFTRCDGAASSGASWIENCGKYCTREVDVPTGYRRAIESGPEIK